jgi:hypothetical protein
MYNYVPTYVHVKISLLMKIIDLKVIQTLEVILVARHYAVDKYEAVVSNFGRSKMINIVHTLVPLCNIS